MRNAVLASVLVLVGFLAAVPAAEEKPKAKAPLDFIVPTQRIEGADDPVPLGELVDLGVSPMTETPPYLVETTYVWKVYEDGKPKRVREYNGGIFFGAGIKPKNLLVECAVTHLYLVKDEKGQVTKVGTRTVLLSANLQIGTPGPSPPPGPDPPPNPPPPVPEPPPTFPDGQYKLSATTWQSATTKVVDPLSRTKGAAALAKSYRQVASDISSNKITDLVTALKATTAGNNQALKDVGVNQLAWDGFGNDLQDAVYKLYADHKINTPADLATAWLEIAAGLDKVK